jgi:hypothetical protein
MRKSGKCGKRAGEGGMLTVLWWENLRERHHLKDREVNGGRILKLIFNKHGGVVD